MRDRRTVNPQDAGGWLRHAHWNCPVISDVIADLIVEMDRTLDTTTVSITHDMKVAFKIADRVAMLHNGQIIEEGTPEQFQRSKNPMVQQFIEGRAGGPLTE